MVKRSIGAKKSSSCTILETKLKHPAVHAPARNARWKSLLLWSVLLSFIYLTLTGFALLFARPWLGSWPGVSWTHWLAGLACLVPYTAYQLSHYARVKQLSAQLHYKLGLLSFYSFLASCISGTIIIEAPASQIVSLVHIMTSFAFLIFIVAHLVIVLRLALLTSSRKAVV